MYNIYHSFILYAGTMRRIIFSTWTLLTWKSRWKVLPSRRAMLLPGIIRWQFVPVLVKILTESSSVLLHALNKIFQDYDKCSDDWSFICIIHTEDTGFNHSLNLMCTHWNQLQSSLWDSSASSMNVPPSIWSSHQEDFAFTHSQHSLEP